MGKPRQSDLHKVPSYSRQSSCVCLHLSCPPKALAQLWEEAFLSLPLASRGPRQLVAWATAPHRAPLISSPRRQPQVSTETCGVPGTMESALGGCHHPGIPNNFIFELKSEGALANREDPRSPTGTQHSWCPRSTVSGTGAWDSVRLSGHK